MGLTEDEEPNTVVGEFKKSPLIPIGFFGVATILGVGLVQNARGKLSHRQTSFFLQARVYGQALAVFTVLGLTYTTYNKNVKERYTGQ